MNELPTPTLPSSLLTQRALQLARTNPTIALPVNGTSSATGLHVAWARHQEEVGEARRLRYAVFAGEMGARLAPAHRKHLLGA